MEIFSPLSIYVILLSWYYLSSIRQGHIFDFAQPNTHYSFRGTETKTTFLKNAEKKKKNQKEKISYEEEEKSIIHLLTFKDCLAQKKKSCKKIKIKKKA